LFDQLVAEWLAGTAFLSSSSKIVLHPSYQRIVGLGERALPLIFNRLRKDDEHWDSALTAITRQNPVSEAAAGRMDLIRDAWLKWAAERGL